MCIRLSMTAATCLQFHLCLNYCGLSPSQEISQKFSKLHEGLTYLKISDNLVVTLKPARKCVSA